MAAAKKATEATIPVSAANAWDSIVDEAKATRGTTTQAAAVAILIAERVSRGILTASEAAALAAFIEPGWTKRDAQSLISWAQSHPDSKPLAVQAERLLLAAIVESDDDGDYDDFGPVVNPDGTPTATTVEMLTGQQATQTPKETPMTAKTATPKTAKTATPKATVAPKADPVAAAVTKVCGAHTRTPDAYCGKDLPLADFNKGSDKDGLDRLCKTCSAAWWAASKARSAAKKADATPKAKATTAKAEATPKAPKAPKAAATPKRDPGARPAVADEADAKRAAADAARLARVKAAVAAAALAENAAA